MLNTILTFKTHRCRWIWFSGEDLMYAGASFVVSVAVVVNQLSVACQSGYLQQLWGPTYTLSLSLSQHYVVPLKPMCENGNGCKNSQAHILSVCLSISLHIPCIIFRWNWHLTCCLSFTQQQPTKKLDFNSTEKLMECYATPWRLWRAVIYCCTF